MIDRRMTTRADEYDHAEDCEKRSERPTGLGNVGSWTRWSGNCRGPAPGRSAETLDTIWESAPLSAGDDDRPRRSALATRRAWRRLTAHWHWRCYRGKTDAELKAGIALAFRNAWRHPQEAASRSPWVAVAARRPTAGIAERRESPSPGNDNAIAALLENEMTCYLNQVQPMRTIGTHAPRRHGGARKRRRKLSGCAVRTQVVRGIERAMPQA